jgi:hypothetical protein
MIRVHYKKLQRKTDMWKPVIGYEGIYEVSCDGRVQRCDSYHPIKKPLKPAANHHGYLNVSLCVKCVGRSFFVHRLVAESFIGPRPDGATINHKNGNKQDNRLANLEYLSHQQNIDHAKFVLNSFTPTRARGEFNGAIKHPDRLARGDSHKSSKLTSDKVRIVHALLAKGEMQQREIAAIVGISQTQIWRIKTGLSWAHVT